MTPPDPPNRLTRLRQACKILWTARDRTAVAWLAGALVAVLGGSLAAAFAPLALKQLVDALGGPEPTPPAALPLVVQLAAILLTQRAFEQAQAFAYGRGEQRLSRRLSAQAFEHMLRLPMRAHLQVRSGALSQTLSDGATGLRLIIAHLVMTIIPVSLQLTLAGIVIGGLFDPATALVLVAALLAYAGVFAWGVARQDGPARAVSAAQIDAGGVTADGLMNVEAIKTFTAEARFAGRFDAVLRGRERQWNLFLSRRLANGLAVALIFAVTLGLLLAQAAQDVAQRALTVGSFVLLYAYLLQLVRPLEMLGLAARDVGQGLAYLDRLLSVFDEPAEPTLRAPRAHPQATGPAGLQLKDVSFAFEPGRPALAQISFEVRPGQAIGVVGPSGSGKTTLLRLILRLYEPDQGTIRLDGVRLSDLPLGELRRQIAVVSQDTILFNDTIAENLRLGEASADTARLHQAAADARLTDLLARLPQGLETQVGERGLKLSGGERQRVAIARAALRNARLVLFDEATAALDAATEQAVWRALGDLAHQTTTITVTHRLNAVTEADQILVLDQGRIVQQGRHAELLRQRGLYAELWRAQSRDRALVSGV